MGRRRAAPQLDDASALAALQAAHSTAAAIARELAVSERSVRRALAYHDLKPAPGGRPVQYPQLEALIGGISHGPRDRALPGEHQRVANKLTAELSANATCRGEAPPAPVVKEAVRRAASRRLKGKTRRDSRKWPAS